MVELALQKEFATVAVICQLIDTVMRSVGEHSTPFSPLQACEFEPDIVRFFVVLSAIPLRPAHLRAYIFDLLVWPPLSEFSCQHEVGTLALEVFGALQHPC